jgi:phospholipid/cholesterol/gamma-HCH transport system substrate-binding protein
MRELKLGIFVFIGTVLIAIGILMLGEVRFEKGYRIHILFNDIGGLLEKAPVRIAGVEVGTVKEITLEKNKAKVTVWLKGKIKVYQDATATIVTSGVVGMKYLEMTRGDEHKQHLQDGALLVGIDPVSFDRVVNQTMKSFDQLVATLQSLTAGGEIPESIVRALKDFDRAVRRVDSFLGDEEGTMKDILDNFGQLSKGLIHLTDRVYTLSDNVDGLTTESRKELKEMVSNLKGSTQKFGQTLDTFNRLGKQFETQISTTVTPVGKFLTDKKFASDLEKTVNTLEKSITTFNELLEGVRKKFKL